jgi:hypothetical protein
MSSTNNSINTGNSVTGSVCVGNTGAAPSFTAAATQYYPLVGNLASAPSFQQLSLTQGVTGVLPIANGGSNTSGAGYVNYGAIYFDGTEFATASTNQSNSGYVLTSTGNSSAPTWQAPVGLSWTNVTGASVSAAVNNGYMANHGTLCTITLPASAAVLQIVQVSGSGAGGWKIAQNAGQYINFGSEVSTTGTGGYLSSTNQYDCVTLQCNVTDNGWVVIESQGTLTVN